MGTGGPATVRVGLAGLGRFGKLHASVLAALPGVELVAVCDPAESEVAAVAARHAVKGRYPSLDAMLAAEPLDACFLVTPEPLHAAQALTVLERRIALFVEKPLAMTVAEGEVVLAAADRAEVPLQVGFLLRFETRHALLKEEIAAGRFGPLVSLRAKRNVSRAWFPAYGDRAHPVYETSIHDIDLLLWYAANPCTAVYAVERNHARLTYPDACWAMLQFASGAVGIIETSWFVPAGAPANVLTSDWHGTIDSELEVVGADQTGRIRLLDGGLAVWQPELAAHPETSLWPESGGSIGGALREQDHHFIDRVRDGSASLIADAADALSGLRVAAAIVESARTGAEVRLAA
jgi:predicted dehydrogenase